MPSEKEPIGAKGGKTANWNQARKNSQPVLRAGKQPIGTKAGKLSSELYLILLLIG